MKRLMFGIVGLVSLPVVIADYGDIMGPGMMGGYGTGMGAGWMWLLGLVWLALAAFIFSVIFWATHNWLVKDKTGRRNK